MEVSIKTKKIHGKLILLSGKGKTTADFVYFKRKRIYISRKFVYYAPHCWICQAIPDYG